MNAETVVVAFILGVACWTRSLMVEKVAMYGRRLDQSEQLQQTQTKSPPTPKPIYTPSTTKPFYRQVKPPTHEQSKNAATCPNL
jgi:hypothetical protein